MEAQRESFIFHMEYIEGVPEELEAQYAMYAINYARYGKEPELTDWRDVRMWNKTKQRIDEEAEKYEKRCSNLKHHKTPKTEERIDNESTTNRLVNMNLSMSLNLKMRLRLNLMHQRNPSANLPPCKLTQKKYLTFSKLQDYRAHAGIL